MGWQTICLSGCSSPNTNTILLRFLKRLFPAHAAPHTATWQPLERAPAQERVRARWLEEQVYLNWAGPYFKAYHFRKAGLQSQGSGLRVQLIAEEGRKGAVFFYDPSIGPGNFQHFFDFLRDRVLALGYNLSTSDQRTLQHEGYSETIEKHFLKPPPKDCTTTGRCNQRYGTITIDLVRINGQPGFIRFTSNPYQDSIFTPPHSFEELLTAVLDLPAAPPEVEARIKQYARA